MPSYSGPTYATLDEWIARAAIPFSLDSPAHFNAAIDQWVALLGDGVDVLGLGEALHGGQEILSLRNRLFQRLVEAHGYTAIAVESSFPRGRAVNEYVMGRGPDHYAALQESGFSHGFGALEANRELVEWMRQYNAGPGQRPQLHFYGFDTPTEFGAADSPRQLLAFALDYLSALDPAASQAYRARMDPLLGEDAAWQDPMAVMDPAKSIGLTPAAAELRLETEELIAELQVRRPELVAKSDARRYREALHDAVGARWLLTYHAALARPSDDRIARGLGLRDAMMAQNLAYIVEQERGRGKVLVFAHNGHVKCGKTEWQLGPLLNVWWAAGAHLREIMGPRYVALGSAVGVSEANGIGRPEPGTLEAHLTTAPGPVRLIPTHHGHALPAATVAALPVRSGSMRNTTYFPLTAQSFADFDWLVVLDAATYSRGGPPLP